MGVDPREPGAEELCLLKKQEEDACGGSLVHQGEPRGGDEGGVGMEEPEALAPVSEAPQVSRRPAASPGAGQEAESEDPEIVGRQGAGSPSQS